MIIGGVVNGAPSGVVNYHMHRGMYGASKGRAAAIGAGATVLSGATGALAGFVGHKVSNVLTRKKSVDNKSVKELTAAAKKQA